MSWSQPRPSASDGGLSSGGSPSATGRPSSPTDSNECRIISVSRARPEEVAIYEKDEQRSSTSGSTPVKTSAQPSISARSKDPGSHPDW